jgi:hypothetical protein
MAGEQKKIKIKKIMKLMFGGEKCQKTLFLTDNIKID